MEKQQQVWINCSYFYKKTLLGQSVTEAGQSELTTIVGGSTSGYFNKWILSSIKV